MKPYTFLIIVSALSLIQFSFPDQLKVFGVKPDLLLASVVIAGLFFELRWAILFSVLAGIIKGSFGLNPPGLDILCFSFWAYVVEKISRKVSIEDNIAASFLLFIVALMQNVASGIFLLYSGNFIPFGIFLRICLLGALYTALPLTLILKFAKARL